MHQKHLHRSLRLFINFNKIIISNNINLPSIITFFSSGCLSGSKVVNVLIPYVFLAILDEIDLGFNLIYN